MLRSTESSSVIVLLLKAALWSIARARGITYVLLRQQPLRKSASPSKDQIRLGGNGWRNASFPRAADTSASTADITCPCAALLRPMPGGHLRAAAASIHPARRVGHCTRISPTRRTEMCPRTSGGGPLSRRRGTRAVSAASPASSSILASASPRQRCAPPPKTRCQRWRSVPENVERVGGAENPLVAHGRHGRKLHELSGLQHVAIDLDVVEDEAGD